MNNQMKAAVTIDEYQEKAVSLAVYPPEYKTLYPTLGLSGEAGEVAEKLIPFIDIDRESNLDPNGDHSDNEMVKDIILEIGDVMWYMATTANDIDMKLSECISIAVGDHFDSFRDAQDQSVQITQYNSTIEIMYPAMMLFAKIGTVSELVKKYVRDDNQVMSEVRKNKIANGIGEIYKYLSCLAFDMMFEMQHCADANLEKLFSRQKRNKIKGDGDHR